MTIQSDMALLAAGSYWDIRKFDPLIFDNRSPLPEGWTVLTQFDKPGSGPNATIGFSARVYQYTSTGEVAISYGGTEFVNTAAQGTMVDFTNGNIPLAIGRYNEQAYQAALLYKQVKAAGLSNISFTGHSLGGGLASVMAVWFNRPAYVFAPAPFQRNIYAINTGAAYATNTGFSAIFSSKNTVCKRSARARMQRVQARTQVHKPPSHRGCV